MIYPVNYISISQGFHQGKSIDFGWWKEKYKGQDILACDDGIIYKIEKQDSGGNVIYIKHNSGIISCYAHLNKIFVKTKDKVKLGQKIATMGSTGKVTGEHLHFGLYSKNRNIYKNADIDIFDVCYVYPNQIVRKTGLTSKYIKYIKYYYSKGNYKLLYSKAIRRKPTLGNNIVKVGNCTKATKKVLTSSNNNSKAKIKAGTIVYISKIYYENNRVWGAYGNCFIVLQNIDKTPQAVKVK
ncbi:MAG: M23 family metallopeptidase [Bacilli bacterium]|nr:M23 family metallopeptidase [Bacilli bacterium]